MQHSSTPKTAIAARKDLGRLLRMFRKSRGQTITETAAAAQIERTRLGRIESGTITISPSEFRDLANVLDIDTSVLRQLHAYVDSVEAASELIVTNEPVFGQEDVFRLERFAHEVRTQCATIVPALLQTEAYMQRVLQLIAEFTGQLALTSYNVETNLLLRKRRQAELHDIGKRFEFNVFESALKTPYLHGSAMILQIDRMIELAGLSNISIRVLTNESAVLADAAASYSLYDDLAMSLDSPAGALNSFVPTVVQRYRHHFDHCREAAMNEADTILWLQDLRASAGNGFGKG